MTISEELRLTRDMLTFITALVDREIADKQANYEKEVRRRANAAGFHVRRRYGPYCGADGSTLELRHRENNCAVMQNFKDFEALSAYLLRVETAQVTA